MPRRNSTQSGALHKEDEHCTLFHKETLHADVMLIIIPTSLLCLHTCVLTAQPRFMEPTYLMEIQRQGHGASDIYCVLKEAGLCLRGVPGGRRAQVCLEGRPCPLRSALASPLN